MQSITKFLFQGGYVSLSFGPICKMAYLLTLLGVAVWDDVGPLYHDLTIKRCGAGP
jgi:hypothetical protein